MNLPTLSLFPGTLMSQRVRLGRLLAVAGVLASLVAGARSHAVSAFGIDGNGFLRMIPNLSTMSSFVLGPTGFATGGVNVGLAIDPNGQLFAGDPAGNLYSLTPTGIPTLIGNPGLGPITGLDWDPVQNNLLVLSATYNISHANPVNGAQVGAILTAGVPGGTLLEDIAWLNPSRAYLTFRDPGNTATFVQLVTLGPSGGALVGTPATSSSVDNWTGVDVDPATGTAYMLGWLDDSWQVANSSGNLTATHIATGNHLDWTAFAIPFPAEAPEPGTGLLCALGLVGALFRRHRDA